MKTIVLSSAKLNGAYLDKIEIDIENGKFILDEVKNRYILLCDVSDSKYEDLVKNGIEFEIFEGGE